MDNNITFIEQEILKSKAKLFDLKTSIEDEEKRLVSLYGALETLQMLKQDNTPNI